MGSNASDDFPDPESPVMTTSLSRGISTSMFLRLCSRAPLMTIFFIAAGRSAGRRPLGSGYAAKPDFQHLDSITGGATEVALPRGSEASQAAVAEGPRRLKGGR